ncbi:uncharacterized SAM-binding protein YcdF (DUF218 family) [Clostridium acetobutylicum]|uniref:Uncharacterized conserved membrane protein of SANA family n=2 Tax=Clostridium acetobutylicum TaxID=1488 RepID=Q97LW3_CLOAB|nr:MULTISPECIES: YdcF family protein [Clostridium]AAK78421.1 Uncharacterized conserved membrane protein of SANA family [Clostridium acetobutylicum ATCC 824]ADZ19491.1 Conserved hypothetical protein [Clostridium acetobutylicum EA 2018]AEI34001.1 hypothetical protein SMB_G0450 [Clostridium acetobutylicum DSM 1731]AWV80143.1 YdcF family protein [Clostridium acetobutylicum]MBC2392324.1 YdcF family protein [Clostridium acetobutylicum]
MKRLKQKTVGNVYIILGALGILYFIACRLTFAMYVNFMAFFMILGILCILFGIFYKKHEIKAGSRLSKIDKCIKGIVCAICVVFIFTEAVLVYNGQSEYKGKLDYIIVLGAGLRGKHMLGTQYERVKKAAEYVKENPDVKIVVSGGKGNGEDISEAEAMKQYFLNKGFKNDSIIMEDKSKNTFENLRNSKKILEKISNKKEIRVGVVTSSYHITRAKLLGKRVGLKLYAIPAPINKLLLLQSYTREFFAFYKSIIFDRG